eukprot:1694184-Pleurochrysis_carterae.AAC.2
MTPAADYCLRLSQPTRAQRARREWGFVLYASSASLMRSQGAKAARAQSKTKCVHVQGGAEV